MSDLKPCPHCASSLGPFVAAPDGKRQVICSTCGTRGPYETLAETAESQWNRRSVGWKDIATAPKDEQILGMWQYFYHGDMNPTRGYSLGEVNEDGQFVDHEGRHSGIFTHWYDFGDGKPMPDGPEAAP